MAFNYLFQSPQTWLKMSRQVGSDWKAITQAVTCNITCNSTFSSQLKVWAVGHMTPHESVGRIIASVVIIIYQFISDFHLIWRKNATVTTGNSPNSQADVIAYSFYSNWLPQDGTTGPALPVYWHLCFKDVREDSEKGQAPGQKTCQVRGNGGGDCELDELGNDTAEENRTPEDYRGWESWGDRWWGRRGNVEGCEWASERASGQPNGHSSPYTPPAPAFGALCVQTGEVPIKVLRVWMEIQRAKGHRAKEQALQSTSRVARCYAPASVRGMTAQDAEAHANVNQITHTCRGWHGLGNCLNSFFK